MFKNIFIEEDIKDHPITLHIQRQFQAVPSLYIDRFDEVWGKSKKPYLHKRDSLNLFIATKRGALLKEAPPAYGTNEGSHFYFIHAYNCIYECVYCYLQGYFNTPDLVIFVNHQEIIDEMQKLKDSTANFPLWFHAGEFSDSLALSHITEEWKLYWPFFKNNPECFLELRTKSVNIKSILDLEALSNVIISFSLSPQNETKEFDIKTPSLKSKIKTIQILQEKGYQVALHFDPIIYTPECIENYEQLLLHLKSCLNLHLIRYLSLGVVRFTAPVYREFSQNYPESNIHSYNFTRSFDNKIRYPKPLRLWLLNTIKQKSIDAGISENKIYLCMEE